MNQLERIVQKELHGAYRNCCRYIDQYYLFCCSSILHHQNHWVEQTGCHCTAAGTYFRMHLTRDSISRLICQSVGCKRNESTWSSVVWYLFLVEYCLRCAIGFNVINLPFKLQYTRVGAVPIETHGWKYPN